MPWEKHSKLLPALLGILLSTTATRAMADSVGSVSAVNQATTGTPPGAAPRRLALGTELLFNEKIETSADGSAQLAFIDRSTLNVGRNSSVVIDKFVYRPGASGGAMSLTLTRGILRFVGGQVSHTAGAEIKTPTTIMGIRGGSATVGYSQDGADGCRGTMFINHVGTLKLRNNVDEVTIRRPGYGVCITSLNAPIPKPFLVSDALLNAFIKSATSRNSQHGGAIDLPTDQMALRNGLPSPRLEPPGNPAGNVFDILSIINSGNAAAKSQAEDAQHAAYGWD